MNENGSESDKNTSKFPILRGKIKAVLPKAEEILKKSGKPVDPRQKINVAAALVRQQIELQEQIETDTLTKVFNLAGYDRRLKEEAERIQRTNGNFVLLSFDVNKFKEINDINGHEAGNIYLQKIAAILKSASRDIDTVARWGGDEFGVILTNTTMEGAIAWWQRVNPSLQSANIHLAGGAIQIQGNLLRDLRDNMLTNEIKRSQGVADRRLYAAKKIGENILITSDENPDKKV